jgi:hypothetical protein
LGVWRSWLAHLHGMQGVRGSNPRISTKIKHNKIVAESLLVTNEAPFSFFVLSLQGLPLANEVILFLRLVLSFIWPRSTMDSA